MSLSRHFTGIGVQDAALLHWQVVRWGSHLESGDGAKAGHSQVVRLHIAVDCAQGVVHVHNCCPGAEDTSLGCAGAACDGPLPELHNLQQVHTVQRRYEGLGCRLAMHPTLRLLN